MSNLPTILKANAIVAAISTVTGETPTVQYLPDGTADIIFSETGAQKIRDFITANMAKKSDVQLEILPVLMPLILKKALPLAAAAVLAILLIGYLIGKR